MTALTPELAPELLDRVTEQTRIALTPIVAADWSVPAHDMDWSCRQTAVHLADAYFAHAVRLVARPRQDWLPGEVVASSASPEELLDVIDACARLFRCAAGCADPASRAWHPWGASDLAGTVAMGAAEGLLHTWDITAALGSDWRPPAALCAPVIERLFPDAPEADPTDALLWLTGRVALAGLPRRTTWRWYSSVRD